MTIKPRGGGVKALVVRPLKKTFFCGFPRQFQQRLEVPPTDYGGEGDWLVEIIKNKHTLQSSH